MVSRVYCDDLIKIKQGALGENIPNADTYVSQKHKFLYEDQLVRAKDLYKYHMTNRKKIVKISNTRTRIYNIMLEKYSIISVNGLEAESLHNESDEWTKINTK